MCQSIWTHSLALSVNGDSVTYLASVGVKYIPKEVKNFIGNKNIITNIYRIQANDSVMCGYFSFGFIDILQEDKNLLDYTSIFSSL